MPFVAIRTENATRLYPDVPAPANVLQLELIVKWGNALAGFLFLFLTIIVWRAYRKGAEKARHILREVLGLTVSSMVVNFMVAGMTLFCRDWRSCAIFGTLPPSVYAISHFFCYRVLALRAMVVQDLMPKWYRKILVLVRVAMFGIFPLDILSYVAFSGKLIFAEGICIMDLDESLPLCLAAVDSTLSGTLLFLFVYPVCKESQRVATASNAAHSHANESRKKMQSMALQNLALSSLPILTTLAYLVTIATARATDETNQHYHFALPIGLLFDTLVNALAVLALFRRLVFPKTFGTLRYRTQKKGTHNSSMKRSHSKPVST